VWLQALRALRRDSAQVGSQSGLLPGQRGCRTVAPELRLPSQVLPGAAAGRHNQPDQIPFVHKTIHQPR